jgi:hypothetical protein
MLNLVFLALLAALTGAVVGLLAAYWFLTHHVPADAASPAEPADPFVSAEIDQAAAKWATTEGRPEAAGIMADKLHMLYDLARRRRQS